MPELLPYIEDRQVCRVEPLCARPADEALAGSLTYRRGLSGEEFIRGRANVQSNWYWSSTTNANNTDNAWIVNMWNGNVNNDNKGNNNYVWPVRSGEWSPLYELFSFENLYRCYLKCRKSKRNTINALKFEANAEENLFILAEELKNRTYKPSRSVCFVVERPKMREIIAADFRDRVVHHLLVERLEAIYEPIFIHDSYACRIDKGIHRAVERTREFIRKGSANGMKKLCFIHLDIKNFFMTIDKQALCGILEKKIIKQISPNPVRSPIDLANTSNRANPSLQKRGNQNIPPLAKGDKGGFNDALLWLARLIIFHNPVSNCIIKGNRQLIKQLPPHKSLFQAPENKGLPVGNLTSQFFANVYLNELDQHVKHILKCRYYIRYCDDFLILDESPDRLGEIKKHIEKFVSEWLKLSLNDKFDSIMPVSNGIDFLGYVIRQDYVFARRRVVNNMKAKLSWFGRRLVLEQGDVRTVKYDYALLEKLRAVLASYWGHLKWADAYNLRDAILNRYRFLKEYFSFEADTMKPLFNFPSVFSTAGMQYCYFKYRFKNAVVFFQVGCFYEFYGKLHESLRGLSKMPTNKRGALYGIPIRSKDMYIKESIIQRNVCCAGA